MLILWLLCYIDDMETTNYKLPLLLKICFISLLLCNTFLLINDFNQQSNLQHLNQRYWQLWHDKNQFDQDLQVIKNKVFYLP